MSFSEGFDRATEIWKEAYQHQMRGHFVTTSRYEWMFWDMGLRREGWPVS